MSDLKSIFDSPKGDENEEESSSLKITHTKENTETEPMLTNKKKKVLVFK